MHLFHYLKYQDNHVCSLPSAYQMFSHYHSPNAFLDVMTKSKNSYVVALAQKTLFSLKESQPDQTGYSKIFEALNFLSFQDTKKTLEYSDFSLSELGKGNPVALFIQFEETKFQTMGSLLSTLYGHVLNFLINSHKVRSEPVMLFFDEIGNTPRIAGLEKKMNTIRSRNLPTWLYWQTSGQMNQYGSFANEGLSQFMSSADFKMFFRLNDYQLMKYVSNIFGTMNEEKTTTSKTIKGQNHSSTVSTKNQQVNVIESHELGELSNHQVVSLYKQAKVIGRAVPYFENQLKKGSKNKTPF